jgi:hypothetical protein
MDEETLKHQLNLELDMFNTNHLTELGNQAVKMGLIAGHGFHAGQYEILRQGNVITLSPKEALLYLSNLIRDVDRT